MEEDQEKVSIYDLTGAVNPEKTSIYDLAPTPAPKTEEPEVDPFAQSAIDFSSVEAEPTPEKEFTPKISQQDVLSDPEKLGKIKTYMTKRMGVGYEEKSDEEVLDDFITHMRWINTNELKTVGEWYNVNEADEETRLQYGDAYRIYDEIGSMWSEGVGESFQGTKDYLGALLTSPSTWIGGIIGRGVGRIGTKATQKKIIEQTMNVVAKEAAKKGGQKGALQAKKEVITAAAKRNALKTATTAAAVDAGLSAGVQDYTYQSVMMKTGVQDAYSVVQGGIAALTGVAGGVMTFVPEVSRGVSGLTDTTGKILKAQEERAAKSARKFAPRLNKAINKLVADWQEMAKRGELLEPDTFLRKSAVDWFFDLENENSFVRLLQESGAKLDFDSPKTLSHQMVEFAMNMPKEFREAYDEALKPLGVSFGNMMDIFTNVMRQAGTDQSKASLAKRFLEDYANVTVAKKRSAENIVGAELKEIGKEAPPKRVIEYATSVWKRALVSHPATTMANIKGWSFAMAGRTMAEIVHGGVLGSVGVAKKLVGISSADKNLAQSRALFANQYFMMKTFLDPFTSIESFSELLKQAPKKFEKQSLATFFGGVSDETPEMFGLSSVSKVVKPVETLVDTAAKLSFVRTQDVYTKTFSGIKELDKQVRLNLKTSLNKLIDEGRTHEITDDMWEKTVSALLKDTFSVDYTKGTDVLHRVARGYEDFAKAPGIGFMMPFARFMNNTMAFSLVYSPLSLPSSLLKGIKTGFDIDTTDRFIRGVIGTSIIGHLITREGEKEAEGLQWYQERTSTGEVKNVQNVFPQSAYNLVGRMLHMHLSGQQLPKDIWSELTKQIGPLAAMQGIGDSAVVLDPIKVLSDVAATDEEEFGELMKLFETAAKSVAGTVLSGFTRPLDPYNDMFGMFGYSQGWIENTPVDKKQAVGMDAVLQEGARYTNNFFNLLLGTPQEDGRKLMGKPLNVATEDKPARQANPLSDTFGSTIETPATNIDKLLGMVNKPPFRVNSFTGNPEYDSFVNDQIFPTLERKATGLLDSEAFKKADSAVKAKLVDDLLKSARRELLDNLEEGNIGTPDDVLLNARRKLLTRNETLRAEAKKALNITTEDRKLSMYEIEQILNWMELEEDFHKDLIEAQ